MRQEREKTILKLFAFSRCRRAPCGENCALVHRAQSVVGTHTRLDPLGRESLADRLASNGRRSHSERWKRRKAQGERHAERATRSIFFHAAALASQRAHTRLAQCVHLKIQIGKNSKSHLGIGVHIQNWRKKFRSFFFQTRKFLLACILVLFSAKFSEESARSLLSGQECPRFRLVVCCQFTKCLTNLLVNL